MKLLWDYSSVGFKLPFKERYSGSATAIRLSSDAYQDATGVRHDRQTIEQPVVTVGRDVLAMVDGGTAPKAVRLHDPEKSIPVRYSISEGSADMAIALATVSSRLAAMPCRQIQPER